MTDIFRLYESAGRDGYPPEWHRLGWEGSGYTLVGIKDLVREEAGHRCVRCGHPYRKGEHPMERVESEVDGEILVSFESWSPCDERCTHGMPFRVLTTPDEWYYPPDGYDVPFAAEGGIEHAISEYPVQALARILTVHHLNGDKLDCRWWNLAALCQRCHLSIQGRVVMARVWPWEHTDWFKPYVAGYYASVYLGEELAREQVDDRIEELLALERQVA